MPSDAAAVEALTWAVVGAGSIGRRHLRNLRQLGATRIGAVRRSAVPLEGDLGAVPVRADLGDAPDPHAVAIVCTPTARHVGDARRALAHGWHVLLEKPVAHSLDGLESLDRDLARTGRTVMVGSCLRFHPALAAVRRRLGADTRPHWVSVWCGQHLADWRPGTDYRRGYSASEALGGGVLLDLIHEIDYLHWLFGDGEVVAAALGDGRRLGIESEDTADLLLRFPGGLIASCHLDYLSRPAVRGGRLAWDGGGVEWDLVRGSVRASASDEAAGEVILEPGGWAINELYLSELKACAATVRGLAPNPSPLADGVRALRTVMQAKTLAVSR